MLLHNLPGAVVADASDAAEVLGFIERHALHGKGIGYADIHLLASAALTPGAGVLTRDKRLGAAAAAMALAHP